MRYTVPVELTIVSQFAFQAREVAQDLLDLGQEELLPEDAGMIARARVGIPVPEWRAHDSQKAD